MLTAVPQASAGIPKIRYELARTYYNLGRLPFDKGPSKGGPVKGPPRGRGL